MGLKGDITSKLIGKKPLNMFSEIIIHYFVHRKDTRYGQCSDYVVRT